MTTVTIFVRHGRSCPRKHRKFARDCDCIKWLRWSAAGKQHRQTTGSREWAVADEQRATLQARLDGGREIRTLASELETFLTAKHDEGCRHSTIRKLRFQIGEMIAFLAGRSIFFPDAITVTDVLDFRSTWNDASGLTRQKKQQNIRGFLRACCGDNLPDLLRVLKTIRLSKADVERLEPQPFSEEEIKQLLASVPVCFPKRAAKITALIRLQISTGLAVRDAVQLERSNIEGGWLRIKRVKTGKPVEQKLSEGLCAELLAVAGPRYIFWSGKGRGETVAVNYLDDLRVIMQAAGLWIPGNTSHRFRDSAVDYWIGEGCSLLEVAAMLGDTVPIVERHYRKLLSKRLQDRLSKVPMREWSAHV